jgi:hypothetical protein
MCTIAELAQDWGLLRTGGVASVFHGTHAQVTEHVRHLNATDEQGSTDIMTKGMTPQAASEWLADMQ